MASLAAIEAFEGLTAGAEGAAAEGAAASGLDKALALTEKINPWLGMASSLFPPSLGGFQDHPSQFSISHGNYDPTAELGNYELGNYEAA